MTGDEYLEGLLARARAELASEHDDGRRRELGWDQLSSIAGAHSALAEFGLVTERGDRVPQAWAEDLFTAGLAIRRGDLPGKPSPGPTG